MERFTKSFSFFVFSVFFVANFGVRVWRTSIPKFGFRPASHQPPRRCQSPDHILPVPSIRTITMPRRNATVTEIPTTFCLHASTLTHFNTTFDQCAVPKPQSRNSEPQSDAAKTESAAARPECRNPKSHRWQKHPPNFGCDPKHKQPPGDSAEGTGQSNQLETQTK